jgi:hypothetical protein
VPLNLGLGLSISHHHHLDAAPSGPASAQLSNASVLDKAATLTDVGQLSGNGGTWSLVDDASGHFMVTSAGQLRVGLTTPDHSAATSHAITVRETLGDSSTVDTDLTVTVNAITVATVGGGGSIKFPRHNGETLDNRLVGPVLANTFGNGTAGADGVIAFRMQIRRGSLSIWSTSSDSDATSAAALRYVLGIGSTTLSRGFTVQFYGPNHINTGYAGRVCFFGKDGTNFLGTYDTSGNAGATGSVRALRSTVIPDDDPRLVCLYHFTSATTFGGVSYAASTFLVVTYKEDGTAEIGDNFAPSAWIGWATAQGAIHFGTFNGGTTGSAQNFYSGALSDFSQIRGITGALTDWQEIAKGKSLTSIFGASGSAAGGTNRVARWWKMSSITDLTQDATSLDTTGPTLTWTSGGRNFSQLSPTYNGAIGLLVSSQGEGYLHGLQLPQFGAAMSKDIPAKVLVIGTATHVQARVTRQADNAVIVDWVRITGSAMTGTATLTIPGVPIGMDYTVEVRREDDNTIVAVDKSRWRVGFKVAKMGQSQEGISIQSGATTSIAVPTNQTVSFAYQRGLGNEYISPSDIVIPVDVGVLETRKEMSDAMLAFAERLSTLAPSVPFMAICMMHEGESMGSFYGNHDVEPAGGDNFYPLAGDGTTAGSGYLTDMLIYGGRDISCFVHSWGTADQTKSARYNDLMAALYGNTFNSGAVMTQVTDGEVVSSLAFSFAMPGMVEYEPHIAIMPINRHADVQIGAPSTTTEYNAFRLTMQTLRQTQASLTPNGYTLEVGGYMHDLLLADPTQNPHQSATDVRGNIRYMLREAHAVLKATGLTNLDPTPSFSSASRSGSVITLSTTLKNGGSLMLPAGATIQADGFEVSADGGTTWVGPADGTLGFSAALVGNTVTLTKTSGTWAANTQVRYAYGGPFTVGIAANSTVRATNYATENTILENGVFYESRTDQTPSNGSGYVQGVPIIPTYTPLVAA